MGSSSKQIPQLVELNRWRQKKKIRGNVYNKGRDPLMEVVPVTRGPGESGERNKMDRNWASRSQADEKGNKQTHQTKTSSVTLLTSSSSSSSSWKWWRKFFFFFSLKLGYSVKLSSSSSTHNKPLLFFGEDLISFSLMSFVLSVNFFE